MEVDEVCMFCNQSIGFEDSVTVSRGLEKIRSVSNELNDGIFNCLLGIESIKCHSRCRIYYVQKRFKANVEDAVECKRLRSTEKHFDFKTHCLFCSDLCDFICEVKLARDRRNVCRVETKECLDSIRNTAALRCDDWGEDILCRVANVIDLVAAEARYHNSCYRKFFKLPTTGKCGRPLNKLYSEAFDRLIKFLAETDECQFTLQELHSKVYEYTCEMDLQGVGECMSEKTLRRKLCEHYADDIILTELAGKKTVVCLRDTGYKILHKSWYSQQLTDHESERHRIVRTAAAIVREDIRSCLYETDVYDLSANALSRSAEMVPDSLSLFLNEVIMKNRKCEAEALRRKCSVIGHEIVAAVRPRSFLSSIQISLAVYIHRKIGSRKLIDLLSKMGICALYDEALRYENSAMNQNSIHIDENAFKQFVFDNADFNVRTLDGFGTFHAMGGIMCVTPRESVSKVEVIKRLTVQTNNQLAVRKQYSDVSVQTYCKSLMNVNSALQLNEINSLLALNESSIMSVRSDDFLYMLGKCTAYNECAQWNGFMSVCNNKRSEYDVSHVEILPFINLPPNSNDGVYNALLQAVELCQIHRQSSCIVTFDQPLYSKAVEIAEDRAELSSVIVRIGGFHLLMSFLGCIGYLMSGSGLEQMWMLVYAKNSVEKMLTGHSFARSLRAHFLMQTALVSVLLQRVELVEGDSEEIVRLLHSTELENFDTILDSSTVLQELRVKFDAELGKVLQLGRTARLWLQYLKLVALVQNFIRAERCGDWMLHLKTVAEMAPYFHAAGHFAYAKSVHLYLQQMNNLQSKMIASEYHKFTKLGYFTVRRSDKMWAGLWTDLTIEQVLMRAIKVMGGLTHGRGISKSVLSRWVAAMPACSNAVANLENFLNLHLSTDEQHVELRRSRMQRDNNDINKVITWLSDHSPFRLYPKLVSIATGLAADESVNCDKAFEVGLQGINKLVGQNFKNAHLPRGGKVVNLESVSNGVKIRDEIIPVNTTVLLHRILCVCSSQGDVSRCLGYELSPYPLSLFIDGFMRKSKKSVLYDILESETKYEMVSMPEQCRFVIDGGFLLHRVVWPHNACFSEIYNCYISFIYRHYGRECCVVFDGYCSEDLSTKAPEQSRRSNRFCSTDFYFTYDMQPTVSQQQFLSNSTNKTRLIAELQMVMSERGIEVKQAKSDADTLIVSTALDLASDGCSVTVVGTDVDLLILLLQLVHRGSNVFYVKSGCGKIEDKIYGINEMHSKLGHLSECLFFIHAVTGCDTVSALYRQGKKKAFKIFKADSNLIKLAHIFNNSTSSRDEICAAGEKFLISLYDSSSQCNSLSELRHKMFATAVARCSLHNAVQLAALPPTSAAAEQHSLRVYHQVQQWYGNNLSAVDWGWEMREDTLSPVTCRQPPAPMELLHLVSCNCKSGICQSRCSCRKAGLSCSVMCRQCHGTSCTNSAHYPVYADNDDDDEVNDCINSMIDVDHEEVVAGISDDSDLDEGDALEELYSYNWVDHEEVL